MNTIPRSEHPKPQFHRDSWMNLNGLWAFEIDNGRSGKARGLSAADAQLSGQILVPFCPQSELSGVNHKDFLYGVWYRRTVDLTKEQLSGRVVLHFGAVDYRCEAFVNGVSVGTHTGGYVSFCFDVTEAVREGENVLTVYAEDDERDPLIPRGKQSELFLLSRLRLHPHHRHLADGVDGVRFGDSYRRDQDLPQRGDRLL